jgi:hypothetical protein
MKYYLIPKRKRFMIAMDSKAYKKVEAMVSLLLKTYFLICLAEVFLEVSEVFTIQPYL